MHPSFFFPKKTHELSIKEVGETTTFISTITFTPGKKEKKSWGECTEITRTSNMLHHHNYLILRKERTERREDTVNFEWEHPQGLAEKKKISGQKAAQ